MADPYHKRPAKYAEKPRRVRGGRKLVAKDWPERLGPIARAFLRIVEPNAPEEAWREGMEYATKGQTRSIDFAPGVVHAAVQGREYRAHSVALRIEPFLAAQWERIVEAMLEQALHAAKLLAGEVPENIDEALEGLGLTLLPRSPEAYVAEMSGREQRPWGRYPCCTAILAADMLDREPLLAFMLRGMAGEELIERIRQRREISSSGEGGAGRGRAPVRALIPGSDRPVRPLEACVEDFWDAGAELDLVETTVRRPEVSKALLRRLGPSPFAEAKFPLVGLLATCYEMISDAALTEAERTDAEEIVDEGEGHHDDERVDDPIGA